MKVNFFKDLRIHQSTRALELPTVEAGLKAAIEQLKVELADTETSLAKAKAESESLAVKIQRKETECDRANQRLTTLNKVRYFIKNILIQLVPTNLFKIKFISILIVSY